MESGPAPGLRLPESLALSLARVAPNKLHLAVLPMMNHHLPEIFILVCATVERNQQNFLRWPKNCLE